MVAPNARQRQAQILRISRKIHRTTGAALFAFFFIVGVTSVLLAWKKNSGGYIQAETAEGTSADLRDWLPLDSLHAIAAGVLHDSISPDLSSELDRIDVRQDKGMAKFIFSDHFWGIQLDAATGKLLQIEVRRSDFIEKIHDGSILDFYLGTTGDPVKLVYSSVMGLALLIFTITGFWLWYGPKRMKRR